MALAGCANVAGSTAGRDTLRVSPVFRAEVPPGTAPGQYALGRIDLAAGRIDSAIVRFRNAILLDPNFVEAHNGLGVAYGRASRLPEAIAAFEEGLRRAPDAPHLLNNLGYTLIQLGAPREAAAVLERAVAMDPSNRQTIENLRAASDTPVALSGARAMDSAPQGPVNLARAPVPASNTVPDLRSPDAPSRTGSVVSAADSRGRLIPLGPNVYEYRAAPDAEALSPAARSAEVSRESVRQAGASTMPTEGAPSEGRPEGRAAGQTVPAPRVAREIQADRAVRALPPDATRAQRTSAAKIALPVLVASQEVPENDRSVRKAPPRPLIANSAEKAGSPLVFENAPRAGDSVGKAQQRIESSSSNPRVGPPALVGLPATLPPLRNVRLSVAGVEVSNGIGVPHFAGRTARGLSRLGVAVVRVSDHWHFGVQRTQILYREGQLDRAEAVRSVLPVPVKLVPTPSLAEGVNVRLILGRDLTAARLAFLEGEDPAFAHSSLLPSMANALVSANSPAWTPSHSAWRFS